MWWRKPDATVLILCTANVCRSPAAEALLRAQLRARGLGRRVRVLSAGTTALPGAAPDPRMQTLAGELGVRLRGQRSRPLTPALLAEASAVYAMETSHLDAADEQLGAPPGQLRELFDPRGEPIGDPYFGNMAAVRSVFERLADCAAARAVEWQRRLRQR